MNFIYTEFVINLNESQELNKTSKSREIQAKSKFVLKEISNCITSLKELLTAKRRFLSIIVTVFSSWLC